MGQHTNLIHKKIIMQYLLTTHISLEISVDHIENRFYSTSMFSSSWHHEGVLWPTLRKDSKRILKISYFFPIKCFFGHCPLLYSKYTHFIFILGLLFCYFCLQTSYFPFIINLCPWDIFEHQMIIQINLDGKLNWFNIIK